ncbi:MAG TPA: hypothetical protein VFF65_11435, partial [Phycisphaerales bacterium]|nr:hypothetical protein [Phycisphaerales bacterium]
MRNRPEGEGIDANPTVGAFVCGTVGYVFVALCCAGVMAPLGQGWAAGAFAAFAALYVGLLLLARSRDLRRTRPQEGLCAACGYDVRGVADGGLCPECGTKFIQPRAGSGWATE